MNAYEIESDLTPLIRAGRTEEVIERIKAELAQLPRTPFHCALDLRFTNPPEEIGAEFEQFFVAESKNYPVGAIYAETNGFSINPLVWYFDLFAFRQYCGHDDYDWLAEWDSDDSSSPTLTGMEELQEVYAEHLGEDHGDSPDLCSLLVVANFQDLIRRSLILAPAVDCPVLATSHDYDFIAELHRIPKTANKPQHPTA